MDNSILAPLEGSSGATGALAPGAQATLYQAADGKYGVNGAQVPKETPIPVFVRGRTRGPDGVAKSGADGIPLWDVVSLGLGLSDDSASMPGGDIVRSVLLTGSGGVFSVQENELRRTEPELNQSTLQERLRNAKALGGAARAWFESLPASIAKSASLAMLERLEAPPVAPSLRREDESQSIGGGSSKRATEDVEGFSPPAKKSRALETHLCLQDGRQATPGSVTTVLTTLVRVV